MKTRNDKIRLGAGMSLAAAAAAAIGLAAVPAANSTARAPEEQKVCKLNAENQKGREIAPNHLVRFNTNLNGIRGFAGGSDDDVRWARTGGTAWASKGCKLVVFEAGGAHIQPKTAAYKFPADTRGIACDCR